MESVLKDGRETEAQEVMVPRLVAGLQDVGHIDDMQHFGIAQPQCAPGRRAGQRPGGQQTPALRTLSVQLNAPALVEILARRDGPGRVEKAAQQLRAVRAAEGGVQIQIVH